MGQPGGTPPDRRVVLLVGALSTGVLLISVVSALVPGMDSTLAAMPVIVLVLVVGTVLVLALALRGRKR